ncbi:hypothetical protein BH09MYX1_BH09MYX1_55300 [soil metagenome]
MLASCLFTVTAIASGCSIATDLDGLRGDGATDASIDAVIDVSVDASTPDTSNDAHLGDASIDAAIDAPIDVVSEPAKPTTTCVVQSSGSGFNHHCNANNLSTSPGGLFIDGDYSNSTVYALPYCPVAYVIGAALVYHENGETFFRYAMTRKVSLNDPGTTTTGTWWVQANGSGAVTVEEMCDSANKGKVKTGTLSVTGSDYTLTWSDGQERWQKQ